MTLPKVLVLGVGPLPVQQARRLYAPGLRTWSFARQLARRGHQVVCATVDFGGRKEAEPLTEPWSEGAGTVTFRPLSFDVKQIIKEVRAIQHELAPECAVATTDLMNRGLAQAHLPVPVWLDFNGHPLVERQMQAAVHGSDAAVKEQWDMVLPALMFGDRFSTCSTAQKHALIGELGVAGRLNRLTGWHDLVEAIPPVCPEREFPPAPAVVRGTLCDADSFILLWTGGYNTWSDVDTLFGGLEAAMERHPRLVYVSTGGAIAGHDEVTFQRFREMVDASPRRARYHFAGWVANEEMAAYYQDADAALNLDVPTYEAMLGFRNRVQEWVVAQVPVLTTPLSEITRELTDAGLATPVAPGNPLALADAIGALIAEPADVADERARRAKKWLRERYDAENLLAGLCDWCTEPRPAPDLPAPELRPTSRWPAPDNNLSLAHRPYLKKNGLL
ncbi:glycosyltransferase [Candidatus Sumerlaeota bacterium]